MIVIPQKKFMSRAIQEAKAAFLRGDYPIGACIVKDNKIIASAGNRAKTKDDSTRHPELELIQYVVGMQKGPYLEDCILYTTHEPCPMCSGACVWSKLGGIVYGNTIDDFKIHTNESHYLKWRTINVSCASIIKDTAIQLCGPFMRDDCNKLFGLGKN
jgi:tRNA(adenine34) deaminase